MDRMEEYAALMDELKVTPPELDGAVDRAMARRRRGRVGRWCGIPAASLAGAAAAFVLLVNVSMPFARACGSVPLLRELAAAAAFSPSLRAAVEHDYVQPVGQSQTDGEVTMTVEYLIVDQKQVNIFFTLESGAYGELWGTPDILRPDGERFGGCSVTTGGSRPSGELQQVTVDFLEQDTPDALRLDFRVQGAAGTSVEGPAPAPDRLTDGDKPGEPEYVAAFTFDLTFDPAFTERGEVYELDRAVELDGQRVTVRSVEVFPTHLRLNLEDDPDNTAWLKGLEFYLEDENGVRYEKISNGITATGSTGTPFMASHRLESSYFGDAEHLTVHITGCTWLDKGREYAAVDLERGTAEGLPQGVELGAVSRGARGASITLLAPMGGEGSGLPIGTGSYSVADWTYRDPEGGEHRFNSMSTMGGLTGEDGTPCHVDGVPDGYFSEQFLLPDYPWDTVELGMVFSRFSVFEKSVEVAVK